MDSAVIDFMTRNEADMAFKRRVKTIFEYIEPGDDLRILDFPCGRGFYLRMLRHLCGCQLVGADLDRAALQQARDNLEALDGIQLQRADVCAMPYPDDCFDAVILSEVLEHIDDDIGALREAWRVLKPGGVLAATVPNANYPFLWDPLNKILQGLLNRPIRRGPLAGIWANHVRLYSAGQLRQAVVAAGFRIADERSLTHYCFPFIHNLVYGLGKPLLESGALPASMAAVADRANFDASGARLNPIRLGVALFNLFDRPNRDCEPIGRSSVNLAIKGYKPHA